MNYDPRMMKLLPFNKRPGFGGESEVRFALRTPENYIRADVGGDFFRTFGLRLSLDSPTHHHSAVRHLWVEAGGSVDNIHES